MPSCLVAVATAKGTNCKRGLHTNNVISSLSKKCLLVTPAEVVVSNELMQHGDGVKSKLLRKVTELCNSLGCTMYSEVQGATENSSKNNMGTIDASKFRENLVMILCGCHGQSLGTFPNQPLPAPMAHQNGLFLHQKEPQSMVKFKL